MHWSRSTPLAGTDSSNEPRESREHEQPEMPRVPGSLPRGWDQTPLRVGIPVAVVVLGCVAASHGDQTRIGAWGLIQALPALYFVSTALLTVSFFLELFGRHRPSSLVLAVHVIGMVVLLHGAPGFLESEPRFPTAWLHVGYTDQILDRGVSAPKIDARFNWPGFFGAAAAVTGAGGLKSALPLLRWAPVFMVLLYLPPLYVIGKHLTRSGTAAWLGLWLFLLVNWVGQDYYAPQALGFVLFLMSIAIMVTFFRDGTQLSLGSRLSTRRDQLPYDGLPDVAAGPRFKIALVTLLVLSAAALAASHQLSPIVLVLASTALVLAGRSRLHVFPVIAGILTLGWISVGATAFWVGHLNTIFGGVGNVDAVVNNSVGERIAGSGPHLTLVHLRLELTAAVWALMALSILILWIRRQPPLTLVALAVVPLVMVVQNYGTEGVLRIFLFSSPFACLIIAQMLLVLVSRRPGQVLVAAAALALIPLFLLTRYGNESFEQVRPAEVQALRTLYEIAPAGSDLVSPTSQVPWRFEHATDYDYSRPGNPEGFRRGDPNAVRVLVDKRAGDARGIYLVITTSQIVYSKDALGEAPHWFDEVRSLLTAANGYRLVYRNADAFIYQWEDPR
jgi:hypothetical protein